MEEVNFLSSLVSSLTGMPSSVAVSLFGLGSYIRGKVKDRRKKKYKAWRARMELEVGRQLDYLRSNAYKAMEERVNSLAENGKTTIKVRYEARSVEAKLGGFMTSYREGLKETAEIVMPCIIDKLENDRKHYKKDDNDKYIVDTGEDICMSFINTLGKKIGISSISVDIEQDVLGVSVFVSMYGKIIRRATGKY